jgi:hypothetical protein
MAFPEKDGGFPIIIETGIYIIIQFPGAVCKGAIPSLEQ